MEIPKAFKEVASEIPKVLREFRAENGLEQEDLAKLLETTQQTVSNWEKGTMPRAGALRRIGHLLQYYKRGEALPPFPDKPTYHPDVRDINWVQVNTPEVGGSQPEEIPWGKQPKIETNKSVRQQRVFLENVSQFTKTTHQIDARIEYHGMRLRADYLSDNVCAEFKRLVGLGPSIIIEHGIFILDTIRRILELEGKPRKVYALFVVESDNPPHHPMGMVFNRIFTAARLHGIEVFTIRSPEDAAQLLESLEDGTLDDLDGYLDYADGDY